MFDFNNPEMVTSKLKELRERNIPHMSYAKLCELQGDYDDTKEEQGAIDKYFKDFCEKGYNDDKDIFSDEKCYFHWGLRHGNMVTNDNGMDRRYYHYLTIRGEKRRIEMLLQYHPDVYEIDGE